MDSNKKFRTLLAEQGIEMTPFEAEKVYKMAVKLKKQAKRLSTEDLWEMEEDESSGIPREERIQIADLYRLAREI